MGMQRLLHLSDWFRARLWLIPVAMSVAALGLAYWVLFARVDALVFETTTSWWLFGGDAGTARDLLSTLLSGMITMFSLVVSITMVVLSLAAGQLGSRLIWNFIGNRQIQTVVGLFLGTILYTLVVLRSINEELGAEHVPHVAVTIASVLVVLCLFALLFLFNRLARSIVSDTTIQEVSESLHGSVARLAEGRLPSESPTVEDDAGIRPQPCVRAVSLDKSGYVQLIDYNALCELGCSHDLQFEVRVRAGQFVLKRALALDIHSAKPVEDDVLDDIRNAFILGADRTPSQDLEYSVRQLVEVAVRALSPGINDPFTAIAVLDRLAAFLEELDGRMLPPTRLRDSKKAYRVWARAVDFEGLADTAFHQIRQAAATDVAVLIALATRLSDLLAIVRTDQAVSALRKHMQIVERLIPGIADPVDRDALEAVVAPALSRAQLSAAGKAQ